MTKRLEGPILVATDLSTQADAALRAAAERSEALQRSLIVITVADPRAFQAPQAVLSSERDVAQGLEERVHAVLPGVDAQTRVVVETSAARAICDLAGELGASLVVVGSHGRHGVERFLLGSVAERTVRHSPCDVLVVRAASRA